MATSGISNFDPTFDDLLQDAAGMVGGGPILAEELISARRGLDYMLTDLQNRNVLLHKIETTTVTVDASTTAFTLDQTISDVLTVNARISATETLMHRYGYESWAEIPLKTQTGRPTGFWFDRRRDSGVMNLWPIPSEITQLVITVQKNTENTVRAFDNVDVPRRFMPAILYGLAYWIGMRRPRVGAERLALLKGQYEQAVQGAMREDRERGSFRLRIGRR